VVVPVVRIKIHRYTGKDVPHHLEMVERDLPANQIVWVSEDGGRTWTRTTAADADFIDVAIGGNRIHLAPDGPEFFT
jgi:hypothetical protein